MRVLIISNMYPSKAKAYSGIFVKNQYEYIKEQLGPKHHVSIFYMKRSFTGPIGSALKYLMTFLRFIPTQLFKRYEIIHVHYFYPLFVLAYLYKLLHKQAKIVVTFHGRDITEQISGGLNQKVFAFLAKKMDCAIAVGETLDKEHIQKKLNRKADSILAAGVDDRVFFQDQSISKKYDFIYVGSFVYRKGTDILIEAFRQVAKQYPQAKFCVAGSGQYYQDLVDLSKEVNLDIHLDQTQSQLRVLYNSSRFNLLPSRNEGFPLSVIEGFYCGLPIIGSDIPQLKEQICEGLNGFTANCNEPDAFGDKMIELFSITPERYTEMSQEAVSGFREVALTTVCNEVISIYHALLNPTQ
jgi:glycosyltransferase involved in cell wall biosynthesis